MPGKRAPLYDPTVIEVRLRLCSWPYGRWTLEALSRRSWAWRWRPLLSAHGDAARQRPPTSAALELVRQAIAESSLEDPWKRRRAEYRHREIGEALRARAETGPDYCVPEDWQLPV